MKIPQIRDIKGAGNEELKSQHTHIGENGQKQLEDDTGSHWVIS